VINSVTLLRTAFGRSANLTFVLIACAVAGCSSVGNGGAGSGSSGTGATSFTLGGTITGLTGAGLVLADGSNTLAVASNTATSFTLPTPIAEASSYDVTVSTQPAGQTCTVTGGTGTMPAANVTDVVVTCAASSFTLGGTISGLTSGALVLADGANTVTVDAGATSFTLPTPVAEASSYAVTVTTQPTGLTCSVANASGTMPAANVTDIAVTCTANSTSYTLGGTISGLTGSGLVLKNNGVTLPVTSGATSFTFGTSLSAGTAYSVSVTSEPAGLTCSLANASGTMPAANVTSVTVTCSAQSYTLGGTISGLTSAGLALANGGNTLGVAANATSFTMANSVAYASGYAVTVATQPTGETCSVANGSGTMPAANVTNVAVTCTVNIYALGGTITGLTSAGLVLANGSNTIRVAANATSFTMSKSVAYATGYAVTVATQPAGLTCSVSGGTGTMPAASVTSVAVACSATTYTLGGTVSGLTSSGLVLANNGATLTVTSGASSFTFGTALSVGATYAVTVQTQPSGLTCSITNASGTMPAANVTNVAVSCTTNPTYTLGGTISGLTSAGLVLANNGDTVGVNSGASSFTFGTSLSAGTAYSVTVQTQPSGLTCSVHNASGTMPAADVTNVTVTCATTPTYTLGGTVSGLTSSGLVLANGAATLAVSSGATGFTFGTGLSAGTAYSVTVSTQPAGLTCSIASGSGTMPAANVTSVAVTCTANPTYTLGGTVSGLTNSGLVIANGGDMLSISSGATSFTFGTSLSVGATYSVTLTTQPAGLTCSIANATGTMPAANVTSVTIGCSPASSSSGNWIFEGGSQTRYSSGAYGTQGVAAAGNIPGARYQSGSWIDNSGHFWIFGGWGTDSTGTDTRENDIWMYDPSSQLWTWEGGASVGNAYPNWGTQGVASSSNTPGGRSMFASWGDSQGNFYMFGGDTLSGEWALCNDLWKYNISTGLWTWLNGLTSCSLGPTPLSNPNYTWESTTAYTGVFGTQGVPAPGNMPAVRKSAVSWIDGSGNLWLFGGISYTNDACGYPPNAGVNECIVFLDDLWKYNPSTNEWAWMSGSQTPDSSGVYGTQGVGSTSNYPSGREVLANNTWADNQGNLWLFGGVAPTSSDPGGNNDLWKYNIASNEWTWVSGSNSTGQAGSGPLGSYGTEGVAASSNVPPARYYQHEWIDTSNNLWMWGGGQWVSDNGEASNGFTINYDDLWKYVPSTGLWTWESGTDNTQVGGNCGTQGVSASTNLPGGRNSGLTWIDSSGNLWLFGGEGLDCTNSQGLLGDLWKYTN